MEVYQIKNFLARNGLTGYVNLFMYQTGSDAVKQIAHYNITYSKELAEQSVTLPPKLRYFLLLAEDVDDQRLIKFIKGKDEIIAYLQETLL